MKEQVILYPALACFESGKPVLLRLECGPEVPENAAFEVRIIRDDACVLCLSGALSGRAAELDAGVFYERRQGFGAVAEVRAQAQGPARVWRAATAFDVADGAHRPFRYGFLCGFANGDEGDEADVRAMNRLHITHAQFYDWMYRHEQLLPPGEDYTDIMGRALSLRAVRQKVELCHRHGMRAIAYGAVYAASHAFYEEHRAWGLLSGAGEVYDFIGRLKIMSLSASLPWRGHIVEQYRSAVKELGFDGIHIDTYGCPKWGRSLVCEQGKQHREEYLEQEFPGVIADVRAAFEACGRPATLVFNNVGNWPVDTLGAAPLDATYIEVWHPYDRYAHLGRIIEAARRAAPARPVVLAAYIRPYLEAPPRQGFEAALLATAAIVAHGGYHLALGEQDGILTQAYYVDYTRMEEEAAGTMRAWCDFHTRWGHVFYDEELRDVSMTHMGWDNYEYTLTGCEAAAEDAAGGVLATLRESPCRKLVSLINLTGNDDCWNRPKNPPAALEGIALEAAVLKSPAKVLWLSPERDGGAARPLPYELREKPNGLFLVADLPPLLRWGNVLIEFEREENAI